MNLAFARQLLCGVDVTDGRRLLCAQDGEGLALQTFGAGPEKRLRVTAPQQPIRRMIVLECQLDPAAFPPGK
ncbi:MAG TPA: hypothetical protein ENN09_02125, partial [Planctomycetes bacterium]|nr:hypothetical protein [Planctomycetota bacterium]